MINIEHFRSMFPQSVQDKGKDILREYLQCQILNIIYDHPIGRRLTFLGGTCLRLVHGSDIFSEDLDFDNEGLTRDEFVIMHQLMLTELSNLGFDVEIEIKGKTAFRCLIKYNNLLFKQGLTSIPDQKLIIQIDTQAQKFDFIKENYLLNKFGIFAQISITPLDILLAQKFYTILNRKRNKGRDFYDVVFLLGRNVKPNYAYLNQKLNINTPKELKETILEKWATINIKEQVSDVAGFLFYEKDRKKIELFGEVIKQARL